MATIGAFAIIIDEARRVCCVRLNYGRRGWTTPGGRVEKGEPPRKALEREIFEETGYRVEVGLLIGVYAKPLADNLVLNFEATITQRTPWFPNGEIAEVRYFCWRNLPGTLSMVARQRIEDGLNGVKGVYREFTTAEDISAT